MLELREIPVFSIEYILVFVIKLQFLSRSMWLCLPWSTLLS